MDINGVHRIPAKWFPRTWIHQHVGSSEGSEDPACVLCRLLQRYVAMNGADAEKVERRVVRS